MYTIAIIAFALAAVMGLIMLKNWLTNKDAPRGVMYTHGVFAATGLVLLIIGAVNDKAHAPVLSIVLFLIAALAGFFMFFRDVFKHKRTPVVAIIHAIVAVTAFVILLFLVL